MTPSRFCNLVWFWMTNGGEGIEQAEILKAEAQLWAPPPGAEARGPWAPEAEMAAFRSLKAQVTQ